MSRDRKLAPEHRPDGAPAGTRHRPTNPVLALQQAAGNRAVGEMLARKPDAAKQKPKPAPAETGPTVAFGKFTIHVSGGNLDAWAATGKGESLEKVVVTSEHGPHSAELARLSKDHTKIKSLTLTLPSANKGDKLDLGSLEVTLDNAVIKGYSVDGTAESWQVVDYDGVHRKTITHNVGQH